MSLKLTLHTVPEVPLETEVISPDRLANLSESEIAALSVYHGNQPVPLGEFFDVVGKDANDLRLEGDLGRVKWIGTGMTRGRVTIDSHAGQHLGAGMSGGEIVVEGNATDWVGPEMSGGRILIKGSTGHMTGSAYRGSAVGIRGGEIIIYGDVGNETGSGMRGGLIAVGGDCGDFTGVNMLAGTIVVLGGLGIRSGAGMRRGTLVSMRDARMLPTFNYACRYQPSFLRCYLIHLQRLGLPVTEAQINGHYHRWLGDAIELNRGEALLFDA